MEFNSSKTVLAKGSGCCGTWIITLYFIFCVFTIVAKNNWIVRILDLIIWSFKLYTCIISILIVIVTIHMLSTAAKLIKECCLLFFVFLFFFYHFGDRYKYFHFWDTYLVVWVICVIRHISRQSCRWPCWTNHIRHSLFWRDTNWCPMYDDCNAAPT